MDPLLEAATELHGGRRFYPPGEHPATYKQRKQLAQLKELRERCRDSVVDEASLTGSIEYIERQIVAFEEQHSEAKADYLARYGDTA